MNDRHQPLMSNATTYGTKREAVAKERYILNVWKGHTGLHKCGLCVHPGVSFLGASPDGKVCDNDQIFILEVKYPCNARDLSLSEAVATLSDFCLDSDGSGRKLKTTHNYFVQVQGQLLVTGVAVILLCTLVRTCMLKELPPKSSWCNRYPFEACIPL